ncbi:sensor histidine kinase [Conexibacter arvalis]|uniref:histidine kinase n=1 Tax=Conexibacter arvalis TaxID=912552 RepID=A0A840IDL0_9ACTN|nr:sensor histidine kinase [Conexibacter arvalis]MBB4663047.1 two-component system sensor histidine kinase UhpB [Conexibacter arvalis]
MPLIWRVLGMNAAVLAVALALLLFTPVTISDPPRASEVAVVAAGLVALLVVDWLLLRRAFEPLGRLAAFARRVDPLRPGDRLALDPRADPQVAEATRAIDEMIDRLETERRDSAREALHAQEAERIRIARELHDEVGQTLTAVVLQLERAVRELPGSGVDAVVEARELARTAAEEVREIARRLRPEALDDLGIAAALVSLASTSQRHTGIRVAHTIDADLPPLDDDAELVVYRVAQEALTNVARHAGTDAAELRLAAVRQSRRGAPAAVELTVVDRGAGFDPAAVAQGGERGIRGMRERAVLIGATLSVESAPGDGTRVRLTVPLDGDGRDGHVR